MGCKSGNSGATNIEQCKTRPVNRRESLLLAAYAKGVVPQECGFTPETTDDGNEKIHSENIATEKQEVTLHHCTYISAT